MAGNIFNPNNANLLTGTDVAKAPPVKYSLLQLAEAKLQ